MNGYNYNSASAASGEGIVWKSFKPLTTSLKAAEMAIMRVNSEGELYPVSKIKTFLFALFLTGGDALYPAPSFTNDFDSNAQRFSNDRGKRDAY